MADSSRWPQPMRHMDDVETPEQAWAFWQPLVTNDDGSLNEEAVRNELADFSMLLRFYSVILCEVTGSRISKTNTHPSAVVSVFQDYLNERVEEAIGESEAMELLREAREYLADTDPGSDFLARVDAVIAPVSA